MSVVEALPCGKALASVVDAQQRAGKGNRSIAAIALIALRVYLTDQPVKRHRKGVLLLTAPAVTGL